MTQRMAAMGPGESGLGLPEPVLHGIDHVELWVGNARQAAHWYVWGMGFTPRATITSRPDRVSHVLTQGDVRLVVTGATRRDSPVAAHVARHGDGVRAIGFLVDDADLALAHAVARGATVVHESAPASDDRGHGRVAAVAAFGSVVHAFVDHREIVDDVPDEVRPAIPLPGTDLPPVGLVAIDHVVANVEIDTLGDWVEHHRAVLGVQPLAEFGADVSTARSALRSVVLRDASGSVTLPVNEPAEGTHQSQIQEFLDANDGPGIQHLAVRTDDIVETVAALTTRGVTLLQLEPGYHEQARARLGDVGTSWDELAEHGILVDRDAEGVLLQVFTEPLQDRPTLFVEIIQRRGATGFGAGNFAALFAAVEREQARRGNL